MNRKSGISVLGCGWLGFPLAKQLVSLGFGVKGSTTTPQKLNILAEENIAPFFLKVSPSISGEKINDFFQSKILVLTIPFRRDLTPPHIYLDQINSVITQLEQSPIRFVIFTSSTSVYPDSNRIMTEDVVFIPESDRARILLEAEQSLCRSKYFQTTVVRFAGLYGGDRQLASFMLNRSSDRHPLSQKASDAPVNLIHLDDAVRILTGVITQNIRGELFNACSDAHPTRKELYTTIAVKRGLSSPVFPGESPGAYKIISNEKIKKRLGLRCIELPIH